MYQAIVEDTISEIRKCHPRIAMTSFRCWSRGRLRQGEEPDADEQTPEIVIYPSKRGISRKLENGNFSRGRDVVTAFIPRQRQDGQAS